MLTSGAGSPGFNACFRFVVQMGIGAGLEARRIQRGHAGLIDGEIDEMAARSASGIIGQDGTMLSTARCPELYDVQRKKEALRSPNPFGIERTPPHPPQSTRPIPAAYWLVTVWPSGPSTH